MHQAGSGRPGFKTIIDWVRDMLQSLVNQSVKYLARDKLSVFLFHAVPLKSPEIPQDFDLPQFKAMLEVIRSHFTVIPLDDAVRAMKRGKLPPQTACLTFDDGYSSWMDGVVPLLERENLHATFYITTGQFAGLPTWHERVAQAVLALPGTSFHIPGFGLPPLAIATVADRRRAYTLVEQFLKYQALESREQLLQMLEHAASVRTVGINVMKATQLSQLAAKGFGIGAHTHSHPILSQCDATTARNEIGQVRETLEGMLGQKVRSFAYPNGRPMSDFTPEHVAMVRSAGYEHAVTTHWGAATAETSEFEIPRFTPWGPTPQRMGIQLARNLLNRPKLVGETPAKPPVVLVAENGAGFGGAVVALRTLLGAIQPDQAEFHVVANMSVTSYDDLPAVRSSRIIPDRLWDTKPLAETISKLPLGPLRLPLHFTLGRVDDVLNRIPYLFRLGAHAWRIKPDVIHGNNEPNSNREAMLVAKVLGIPYVQHLRGELAPTKHLPWMLGSPTAFIPVSRWLAGELLVRNVPCERIRHVYDAVDWTHPTKADLASVKDLRVSLNLSSDIKLVAMVGMFVSWKGQDLFVDAVEKIYRTEKNIVFLLIGDTPEHGDISYASMLKKKVDDLGLTKVIYFLGKIDNLNFVMPQLNVVVSASTRPEPLGLVMMEALAAGSRFVGPNFGAATEVVSNSINGHLFEPGSAESLAHTIVMSLNNVGKKQLDANQYGFHSHFLPISCAQNTLRAYSILR